MAGRRVSRLRDVLGGRTGAILVVVVLCSLLVSGCGDIGETLADLFHLNGNGNGDAAAQGERRIETFFQVSNFVLEADTEPGIVIDGDTTRYNIQSDATLNFTSGERESFTLEADDIVIERPAAGVVTVIRDNS